MNYKIYVEKNLALEAECSSTSQERNSVHFVAPEVSLPCPQEPATCSYPETDESSLHPPIIYLEDSF
jgi:hypothetical protein